MEVQRRRVDVASLLARPGVAREVVGEGNLVLLVGSGVICVALDSEGACEPAYVDLLGICTGEDKDPLGVGVVVESCYGGTNVKVAVGICT